MTHLSPCADLNGALNWTMLITAICNPHWDTQTVPLHVLASDDLNGLVSYSCNGNQQLGKQMISAKLGTIFLRKLISPKKDLTPLQLIGRHNC